MDRRYLIAALCLFAGSGCGPRAPEPSRASAAARPSILVISIDTLRADRLGCYGASAAETPNIDAWAREGVLFENAVSPVPITLPAHASMLTGLLPYRHGVRDNGLYRLPPDVPTLAARLAETGYDTGAVVAAAVLDRQYGLARGFRLYDDDVGGRAGLAIAERPAGAVTDAAVALARQLRAPFFLFVHYFDPHAAYRPPAEIAGRFGERPYDGEVAYVDREIGRLRRELGAALDAAAIVITADHGESLGEHGEATHGVFLYQSTLHVPLIVAAAGWPKGRRVSGLASNLDVTPTLLEIAGTTLPGLDGRALGALARSEPSPARSIPLESEFGLNSYGWSPLVGLTDGALKWIGAPEAELYDLAADPAEAHSLLPARAGDARRLATLWREAVVEDRRATAIADASDPERSERLAQLSALGYVAGSRAPSRPEGGLTDPKRAIGSLALVNEARQLIGARRFDDALRRLDAALKASPRNVSALVLAGVSQLQAGRPRLALAPLRRAGEIAPANADVQFNLGLACVGVNDAACAEQAWRRCLSLAPRNGDAAANLADLLIQTARPAEAREVVAAARREGLAGGLLDFLEGKLAFLQGERVSARATLSRALESRALPPPAADEARRMLAALGP